MTRRSRSVSSRLGVVLPAVLACATLAVLVVASPAEAATFSNPASITTNRPGCGSPAVASIPYPSNIVVSGLTGTISDVNVTLTGMNNFEGDFEVLLVSPTGANLLLLSDAGSVDVSDFTLTLDDSAASLLPQNGSWGPSPRTAKPTDYAELSGADTFPEPAPPFANRPAPAGTATLASVFNGGSPNGTWSLYVVTDVCDAPAETITGGWSLDITTTTGAMTTTSVSSTQNPSTTGSPVTFTATVTSGGNPVTTGTVTFTEGATTLGAPVALNGSGQATITTSTLPEGSHTITATYDGTSSFNTSNGAVTQRVNNATIVTGSQYCNTGPITINALPNPATPYPSNIMVTGAPAVLGKVTVTLKNVSHPFPDDIDILLVGPTGQNLVLVSDAGSPPPADSSITNVTVTLDDAAASFLPATGPWGAPNSTFSAKPTDYDPAAQVDTFAAPAPAPSAATTLSTFSGTNPNGTWSLYVVSDGAPDTGSIAGGWCVTLTAALANPTLSNAASAGIVLGGTVSDTATLAAGNSPTGTITFTLYGPGDTTCASPAVFTSTVSVSGNGSYPSGPFTPTAAGTYQWRSAYSGDALNNPVSTPCGAANSSVVVSQALAGISSVASAGGPPGTTVTDTATVTGFSPTGTVTFTLYNNNTCTGAPAFTSAGRTLTGGSATSAGFPVPAPGTYYWIAAYSGDANNTPVTSLCGAANESVAIGAATPTIVTTASPGVAGGQVFDTAVLSGASSPTGVIVFRLYGPDNATCTGPEFYNNTVTVTGNGTYQSLPATVPGAGVYRWTADYLGDTNNTAVYSPCNAANEAVTVAKANPTLGTTASGNVTVGGQVHDTATLAGGAAPTGTIGFSLYGPDNPTCSGSPAFTLAPVAVAGNGSYDSANVTPTLAGVYRWTASYSGDANNNPALSACNAPNESVTVSKAAPTISTQASPGNLLGASVRDVATVAGGAAPTGSVTFRLFSNNTCATLAFTSTNSLAGGTSTSDWFTPTAAGTYYWTATYNGDASNNPATSPCQDPNESVVIAPFQPPAPTQTITGDYLGPLTVNAGQSVLITGARVVGPVTVNPGGALTVVNSQISRGITADAPSFFSLCGAQVAAPSPANALSVTNASVPIQVGDPAAGCAGNRFASPVVLASNLAVTFGANIVSTSATINNNGPGSTVVKANTLYGALNCSGNNPPPTNAGQVNTAASKTGQCAAL